MTGSGALVDSRPPGRHGVEAAVLLCADVTAGTGAPFGEALEQALWPVARSVPIAVATDACSGSPASKDLLRSLDAQRVVVACRQGRARRDEIVAHVRRAGVHPAGIAVVELATGTLADVLRAAEESAARVEAALALVSAGDLSLPAEEKIALDAVRLSRRGLFRFGMLARRPVVTWVEGGCEGLHACRSCVAACPRGALSRTGPRLLVDAERCSGCGACLGACRTRALALSGTSIEGLERAANRLASHARRLGPPGGIAITCADAGSVPLGEGWLPLEVPSLEMVTAGWLLQILAVGATATILSCTDQHCRSRARELLSLSARVLETVRPPTWRDPGAAGGSALVAGHDVLGPIERCVAHDRGAAEIVLREPEATVRALSKLAAPAAARADVVRARPRANTPVGAAGKDGVDPWRIESALSPLGIVSVDGRRCSGCGTCARSCPTAALGAERATSGDLTLSFDASACSACGACAAACPERCVVLQRVLDGESIEAGRRELVTVVPGRCASCGRPIGAGLSPVVVSARLASSHPALADRLTSTTRCTDCLLRA